MSGRRFYILLGFDNRQAQDQALSAIERTPPAGLVQATDYNPRRRCQRIRTNTITRRQTEQDRLRARAVRQFVKTQCSVDPRRAWAEEHSLQRAASWLSRRQVYEAFRRWLEGDPYPYGLVLQPYIGFCMAVGRLLPKGVKTSTRTFDGQTLLGWSYLCVKGLEI
jgi:hypothetical protein